MVGVLQPEKPNASKNPVHYDTQRQKKIAYFQELVFKYRNKWRVVAEAWLTVAGVCAALVRLNRHGYMD